MTEESYEAIASIPEAIGETDTVDHWRNLALRLEMELGAAKQNLEHLISQTEDLSLNLEIANERWVKSVNEQATTEVALRKLMKKAQ